MTPQKTPAKSPPKTSAKAPNDGIASEDLDRNLKEIFNWYALKFIKFREGSDFDGYDKAKNQLPMVGFANFCKEFRVELVNRDITEAFKKSLDQAKPMQFEQFDRAITKLGVKVNEARLQKVTRKLADLRKEMQYRESKEKGDPRIREKFAQYDDRAIDDLFYELIDEVKDKTETSEEEAREQLVNLLELGDPLVYRTKMEGLRSHLKKMHEVPETKPVEEPKEPIQGDLTLKKPAHEVEQVWEDFI